MSGTPTTVGSYNVTYSVRDSGGPSQTASVTFRVTVAYADPPDPPDSPPVAPAPTGLIVLTCSDIDVTLAWDVLHGADSFKLEKRAGLGGSWVTISGSRESPEPRGHRIVQVARNLESDTVYYFRVSARGDGDTYSTEYGPPSREIGKRTGTCLQGANQFPVFPAGETGERSIDENTGSGVGIGDPVEADDTNNDPLTYTLGGPDAANFDIGASSGQLQTKGSLDYETESSYSFTLSVSDQKDAHNQPDSVVDAIILLTINVTDVDEPGRVTVTLPHDWLQGSTAITAELSDPDRNVSNQVWKWQRASSHASDWSDISTESSYTVVSSDQGNQLRAVVSYSDIHSASQSAISPPIPVAEATPTPPGRDPKVSYASSTYSATEGVTIPTTIWVELDRSSASDLIIPITFDPTPAASGDYSVSGLSGENGLTIEAGATLAPFRILALEDVDCVDESISLGFGDLPVGVGLGDPNTTNSTATFIIHDDEFPADCDDDGYVELEPSGPVARVGMEIAATLMDPDTPISGSLMWQWQRLEADGWLAITEWEDANTSSYTPKVVDVGKQIRAAVAYADSEGPGKIAYSPAATVTGEGTPTPIPPEPSTLVISIARHSNTDATIDEGGSANFTLTASVAPDQDLQVTVSLSDDPDGGSFLPFGPHLPARTIPMGETSLTFTVYTFHDNVDEKDGEVVVTAGPGYGYTVSDLDNTASVEVRDIDKPLPPTGIKINGHITNNSVSVWWESGSGVEPIHYEMSYGELVCDGFPYQCGSKKNGEHVVGNITATWQPIAIGENLPQIQERTPYYLTVYTVNGVGERSERAYPTLIYPTDEPLRHTDPTGLLPEQLDRGLLPVVLKSPIYGYISKTGSDHHFRFRICEGLIPLVDLGTSEMVTNPSTIASAVHTWPSDVNETVGTRLIGTSWDRSGTPEQCRLPRFEEGNGLAVPVGDNTIQFRGGPAMEEAKCALSNPKPLACWRSYTLWESRLYRSEGKPELPDIKAGTILVRQSPTPQGDVADWRNPLPGGCMLIEHAIIHEVGHAFGIGNPLGDDYTYHGDYLADSVMSDQHKDIEKYCSPQYYDEADIRANYQSRHVSTD